MAKIKEEDIEAVRERAALVDIVSEHVQLKKTGRSYVGRCPFHDEKSPSFSVDPAKGLFHCFGCGEGGDVFSFVMKTAGLDFTEAVEALASKTGYELTYERSSAKQGSKQRLYLAHKYADLFFRKALRADVGSKALAYSESRGMSGEVVDRFGIGYAPDSWDMLSAYLSKKGFTQGEIVAAGLASGGNKLYDRFRNRLMFPIVDLQERVVGFGGRALGDEKPKYLNSPETAIYHKGSMLYGLFAAKQALIEADTAIIVEGYTDVILLVAAGIGNVVATLGTALTGAHIRLVSRFCDDMVMVFDGDSAGISAAERVREFLEYVRMPGNDRVADYVGGVGVRVLVLPDGADPADFVTSKGAAKFLELVGSAPPFPDFYLSRIADKHDLSVPVGRRKAAAESVGFIAAMPSAVDRDEYTRRAAGVLGVSAEALSVELRKAAAPGRGRQSSATGSARTPAFAGGKTSGTAEREMLKLVLQFPAKAPLLAELEDSDWQEPLYGTLVSVLKTYAEGKAMLPDPWPKTVFEEDLMPLVSELSLEELRAEDVDRYAIALVLRLKEFSVERQMEELKQQLGAAGGREAQRAVQERMLALTRRKQELRGQIVQS